MTSTEVLNLANEYEKLVGPGWTYEAFIQWLSEAKGKKVAVAALRRIAAGPL